MSLGSARVLVVSGCAGIVLAIPRGAAAEAYLHFMRAGCTTGQVVRVDAGGSVV